MSKPKYPKIALWGANSFPFCCLLSSSYSQCSLYFQQSQDGFSYVSYSFDVFRIYEALGFRPQKGNKSRPVTKLSVHSSFQLIHRSLLIYLVVFPTAEIPSLSAIAHIPLPFKPWDIPQTPLGWSRDENGTTRRLGNNHRAHRQRSESTPALTWEHPVSAQLWTPTSVFLPVHISYSLINIGLSTEKSKEDVT